MTISDEGIALGHKYEMSRFGGGCWCYKHDRPLAICDYEDDEDDEDDDETETEQ